LGGQPAVLVHNDLYPLHTLSQYLSLPVGQVDEKAPILLVNAGGHRVAMVVDDIKGKYEIVMKNLGPHLRHVHGVAGATVLGNGRVVLVLELIDLLSSRARNLPSLNAPSGPRRDAGAQAAPAGQAGAQAPSQAAVRQNVDLSSARQPQGASAMAHAARGASSLERGRHVLVVDDSPSVRRVVGGMLKQNGWEVQMARDGVEALEMITYEPPAAVLLDIEMPRMDGYELISTVRAQEQFRTLPLVVLTSRAAAKHQQRALQLGANGYVVKPYQDEELLNLLSSLVYSAPIR
jgi:CheY-like chemotaxis protein